MEDYKPNSHLSKAGESKEPPAEPQKRYDKVVKGTVKRKEKSGFKKAMDSFFPEADGRNIKDFIIFDVLIPALKGLIDQAITGSKDMLLYGERREGKRRSTASKISYRDYYEDKYDRKERDRDRRRIDSYDYDDIIFDSKGEALDVLSRLDEIIDKYQVVSVADFYDLCGVAGKFTDNKYGWTDLARAQVVRVSNGEYVIKFPRALPID